VKKGAVFLIFVSLLFAKPSLKLIYSTATNSLKSIDFKKGRLLYSTVKNVYLYNSDTGKTFKKYLDNVKGAKFYPSGRKFAVLTKFDGLKIFNKKFVLIRKIPGSYKNFFIKDGYMFLTDDRSLEIFDIRNFKLIREEKIGKVVYVDYKNEEYEGTALIATLHTIFVKNFQNPEDDLKISMHGWEKIKKVLFIDEDRFTVFVNNRLDIYDLKGKKLQSIRFGYKKIKAVTVQNDLIFAADDTDIYVFEDNGNGKYVKMAIYSIKPVDLVDLAVDEEFVTAGGKYRIYVYTTESQNDEETSDTFTSPSESEEETLSAVSSGNFDVEITPKYGKAPLEITVILHYGSEIGNIKKLSVSFDGNLYDISDTSIKKFSFVFNKPGIHRVGVIVQTDKKTYAKDVFVNVTKE